MAACRAPVTKWFCVIPMMKYNQVARGNVFPDMKENIPALYIYHKCAVFPCELIAGNGLL